MSAWDIFVAWFIWNVGAGDGFLVFMALLCAWVSWNFDAKSQRKP